MNINDLLDNLARRGVDLKAEVKADLKREFAERKFQSDKVQRDIAVQFVYPPIPDRSCDWRAVFKNYDEPGCLEAYGPTPEAAVRNLMDLEYEEYRDAVVEYAVPPEIVEQP